MRYFYSDPVDDDEDDGANDGADDAPAAAGGIAYTRGGAHTGDDDGEALGDDTLEDDFPLGDGTAETSAVVYCPYCGELNEISVDPGGGASQSYIEDCQVCCRPWRVAVAYDADGQAVASVEAADDL